MLNIFSEELKKRREEVGLSIQQLASKTKIDKKYLEFIEQGNFSFLPELYVKSFIRSYAKFVDLDPEETIKKYLLAKEGKLLFHSESEVNKPNLDSAEENQNLDKKVIKSKSFVDENVINQTQNPVRNKNGKLIILSTATIGLLLIFVIYYFYSSQREIIVEETPFEEIVNQDKERFEETANNLTEDSSLTADSLSLEIFSKDTTWVFLILDNSSTNEITLYPNKKIIVKAKNSFEGTIGNSGSTILKLNDKNLDFVGRKYLPRHFKINRSTGLEYLNARPILNNQDVR